MKILVKGDGGKFGVLWNEAMRLFSLESSNPGLFCVTTAAIPSTLAFRDNLRRVHLCLFFAFDSSFQCL